MAAHIAQRTFRVDEEARDRRVPPGATESSSGVRHVSTHALAPRRLLIVGGNHELTSAIARAVVGQLRACTVECASSFEAGLESLAMHPTDVVIIDLSMRGPSAEHAVRALRASNHGAKLHIIGMTGEQGADHQSRLRESGADHCLGGPWDAETLVRCLGRLARSRLAGPRDAFAR